MSKPRTKQPKREPRRRVITVSASHPIWAEVVVYKHDGDDTWTIESVRRHGSEVGAQSLMESMGDSDLDEMDRKADAAEDIE